MRINFQPYNCEPPVDDDYKAAAIYDRDKENFESLVKCLYLGADSKNAAFAKIGITMGNLASRSYSSSNPGYYLFCAFQCTANTTKAQLENVEKSVLSYLDKVFTREDGTTKREPHFESQRISECYYDIDFEELFKCLHDYLYDKHIHHFTTHGFRIGDSEQGVHLSCHFNQCIPQEVQNQYKGIILQR